MARDPGSLWLPLPEAGAPDGYRKDKFIVHSTGSNGTARATWNYFVQTGVVNESTFIVGVGPHDPTLQIMDSTDNADANVAANQSGISVEVVGDGYGGYNDWQRSELIRLGRWAASTHPIKLQVVPTPTGSGFGWHIMFGSPGPWTNVVKICPGARRIEQLERDIFPAIFAENTAPAPLVQEDDDMPLIINIHGVPHLLDGPRYQPINAEFRNGLKAAGVREVVLKDPKDETHKALFSYGKPA